MRCARTVSKRPMAMTAPATARTVQRRRRTTWIKVPRSRLSELAVVADTGPTLWVLKVVAQVRASSQENALAGCTTRAHVASLLAARRSCRQVGSASARELAHPRRRAVHRRARGAVRDGGRTLGLGFVHRPVRRAL